MKVLHPEKGREVDLKMIIDMTTPGAILLSSLMPAVLGVVLSYEYAGHVSWLLSLCLVLIPSLMNASVDVLNDYFDYISGNDTYENVVSEMDGPLAYNNVKNPKPAFYAGLGFMLLSVLLGIYVVCRCGPKVLIVGIIGAVIALTYSGFARATSRLPVGEVLAGFTLGGLVPFGVFIALTGSFSPVVLFKAIPMMLIVSQFMLSNNTCDLERDQAAGRVTLPILIGRRAAGRVAGGGLVIWLALICGILLAWYPLGLPWMLLCSLWAGGAIRQMLGLLFWEPALFRDGPVPVYAMTHENKTRATLMLTRVAFAVAFGYPGAIWLHLIIMRFFG